MNIGALVVIRIEPLSGLGHRETPQRPLVRQSGDVAAQGLGNAQGSPARGNLLRQGGWGLSNSGCSSDGRSTELLTRLSQVRVLPPWLGSVAWWDTQRTRTPGIPGAKRSAPTGAAEAYDSPSTRGFRRFESGPVHLSASAPRSLTAAVAHTKRSLGRSHPCHGRPTPSRRWVATGQARHTAESTRGAGSRVSARAFDPGWAPATPCRPVARNGACGAAGSTDNPCKAGAGPAPGALASLSTPGSISRRQFRRQPATRCARTQLGCRPWQFETAADVAGVFFQPGSALVEGAGQFRFAPSIGASAVSGCVLTRPRRCSPAPQPSGSSGAGACVLGGC